MTHVCHVMCHVVYSSMLLYSLLLDVRSNSYSVPKFLNPIITDIFQNMTDLDSSAGEDRARFKFVSWCNRCGHQFRTKQHALRHLARCPPPHELRCGCCGVHYSWTDFVQHVNVRGVCRRRQRCYLPPLPSEPQYNISCCSLLPPLPLSRQDALPRAAPAAVAASPLSYASISLISSASLTSQPLPSPAAIAEPSATLLLQPATDEGSTFSPPSSTAAVASFPFSYSPISDPDLQAVLEDTYSDLAHSDWCPPSIPSTTAAATSVSDLASSSLHSPATTSSATAPVQPLYAAQSPSAVYLADQPPPPLPRAAALPPPASPSASLASAASATSALPVDDRHVTVALAAHALWLARVLLAGTESTAQRVTDEASRELLTLGDFWLTPLADPHAMPLHQLLYQMMPVWRHIFTSYRRQQ